MPRTRMRPAGDERAKTAHDTNTNEQDGEDNMRLLRNTCDFVCTAAFTAGGATATTAAPVWDTAAWRTIQAVLRSLGKLLWCRHETCPRRMLPLAQMTASMSRKMGRPQHA